MHLIHTFVLHCCEPGTVDALRRLQALKELSKLGSGFELANRDLEIRGSGSLIGQKQSGLADRVGPEVYMALLQEALEEAKGTNVTAITTCAIELPVVEAMLKRGLPASFLPGNSVVREEASAAAMSARKPKDIAALASDWRARLALAQGLGQPHSKVALPPTVEAFLKVHMLQGFGRRLGVTRVSLCAGGAMELEVPAWSPAIWVSLTPTVDEIALQVNQAVEASNWIKYDDELKVVVLEGLGREPPAKQLAALLVFLGKIYIFLEGQGSFGFT
jgi:hypothetical protein